MQLTTWIIKLSIFKFWKKSMWCIYDFCLWFCRKLVRVKLLPLFLGCNANICVLEIKITILAHSLFQQHRVSPKKKTKKKPRYSRDHNKKSDKRHYLIWRERRKGGLEEKQMREPIRIPLPWLNKFGVGLIRDVNAQTSCTGFGTDTGPGFPWQEEPGTCFLFFSCFPALVSCSWHWTGGAGAEHLQKSLPAQFSWISPMVFLLCTSW